MNPTTSGQSTPPRPCDPAHVLPIALLLLLISGCKVSQYIPEGEYLYNGAEVEVVAADSIETAELSSKLTATLNNNTNSKIPLIGYRGIWRYYKNQEKIAEKEQTDPEKAEELRDKEIGEEPIYYDESVVDGVEALLENRAGNSGYFNHSTTYTTDTVQDPPAIRVKYTVRVGDPYDIRSLESYWRDSSVARLVRQVEEPRLRVGERYDLDDVKGQRQQYENILRDSGYYFSRAEDFMFLADTVGGFHKVAMLAKLKDDLPPQRLQPQYLRQINVYPNVDPADTIRQRELPTYEVGGITVHCEEPCTLRPEILDEAFAQRAGNLYSPLDHSKTLRRLANYNTFRYISMAYKLVPGSDSLLVLDAFMQPLLRRRIEAELGGTYNNAGYVGPSAAVTYTNRNLLRGAELFRLTGDMDYAVYTGNELARISRSASFGLSASLNVPRLWLPKRRKLIPRVITSSTIMQLSAKFLNQGLNLAGFNAEIGDLDLNTLQQQLEEDAEATETINLITARAKFGYSWRRRVTKDHVLYPFSIHVQDPVVSNEEVLQLARSQGLAGGSQSMGNRGGVSRYDRMIVYSPGYTMTYDSRLKELKTHSFFWLQYLSMNWNNVFPVGEAANLESRITSIYPQVETDFRYYLTFNDRQQLAVRAHGGIAYPITDRAIVPFYDLYTIGGPNSLRGFNPLQLGPGRTVPIQNNQLTTGGFGNVLLEGSIEFRQRLNSLFELAAFLDVGNIWTYNTDLEPLDTDFRRESFIDELAMNYGGGVRVDLQFLILRLDLAYPFQVPYEDNDDPDVVLPEKSLNFVLAFGYPF